MGRVEIGTVVGIGGKYCAGKSIVAHLFVARGGYDLIDVDAVGHKALEVKAEQIVARFGSEIIGQDKKIDRAQLGRIVFQNRNALHALEEIVHPWMTQRVAQMLKKLSARKVVIDAALLCQLDIHQWCDVIVWVHASYLTRVIRSKTQRHTPLSTTLRIIHAQKNVKLTDYSSDMHIMRNNLSRKRFIANCIRKFEVLWE